jgi:acetyltransferase-like isoleucine patch superfamily enzyme
MTRVRARTMVYSSPVLSSLRDRIIGIQNVVARIRVGAWRFAEFGKRSVIRPPVRVAAPECIFIGDEVSIGSHAWFSVNRSSASLGSAPMLVIGSGTKLGEATIIVCAGKVEIGPNVLAASNVFIADTYHQYVDTTCPVRDQGMAPPRPVKIGEGSFLGFNAMVLPGVTIGERAYIGAGAVVTHDVPSRSVVAGNPARIIRQWDEGTGAWVGVPCPPLAPVPQTDAYYDRQS